MTLLRGFFTKEMLSKYDWSETMQENLPDVRLELITPAYAQELLARSQSAGFDNRTISIKTINHYAELIKKGEWTTNNDMICVASDGSVTNGQHRLHAVIRANVPIRTFVWHNAPKEAFDTMDRGKPRKDADILTIMGIERYASDLASGIKQVLSYFVKNGEFSTHLKINVKKSFSLYEKYKTYFHYGLTLYKRQDVSILQKSLFVGLCVLFFSADEEKANSFFETLTTGAYLSPDDTLYHLRSKLAKIRLKANPMRLREAAFYTVQAWNFYVQGNLKRKLKPFPVDGNYATKIIGVNEATFFEGIEFVIA